MSKYQAYAPYINRTALEGRISRFNMLSAEERRRLETIITTAKAEQLQTLEVKVRSLLEYSGIEPEVLSTLVAIVTDVSPEARNLDWERAPDTQLQAKLQEVGLQEEYYGFCLNLRHEYLLNKPVTGENGVALPMADKLLIRGHGFITKYIIGNPLALEQEDYGLVKRVYPEKSLKPLARESDENALIRAARNAANTDFTLSGEEIEHAVSTYLTTLVQEQSIPAAPAPETTPPTYSDAMSGDLSAEQYSARVRAVQLAQNGRLLVRAVRDNDIAKAQHLLTEQHVDPTIAKADGRDVLTIALFTKEAAMSQLLWRACPLNKKFERLTKVDQQGWYSLQRAVHAGHAEVIAAMLEGLLPEQQIKLLSKKNLAGASHLEIAINLDHAEVMAAMLKGLSPEQKAELITKEDQYGSSLLLRATNRGSKKMLTTMLEGLSPERKVELVTTVGQQGWSPLSLAVYHGHTEVVDAMHEWKKNALLLDAVHNNNAATVTTMLEGLSPQQKAELVGAENMAGVSPLSHAVFFGNTEIVAAMLEGLLPEQKAALVGKKNKYGDSPPLYQAERYGYTQIVDIMLEGLNAEQKATIQCDRPTSFVQRLQGRPTAEQSWVQLAQTPSPSSTGKGA